MRVDRDQADRALAFERAEPLLHMRDGQTEAALFGDVGGDQFAVLRVAHAVRRDRQFAAPERFLVDRNEPPAALRQLAENPEHAVLGAIEDLDHASGVADLFVAAANFVNAQEHAIADARSFAGLGTAGDDDPDFRRRRRVPASSHSAGAAINSPSGSRPVMSASDHRRQCARLMQLLAALLDGAAIGEIAQHALELSARGILQAEGARDFAGADFAGAFANKGDELLLGRKSGVLFGLVFGQFNFQRTDRA